VVQDYASTNSVILNLEIYTISWNVRIFKHRTVHELKRQPSLRLPQNGQTNYKQSAHASLLAGDQPENKFAFRLARLWQSETWPSAPHQQHRPTTCYAHVVPYWPSTQHQTILDFAYSALCDGLKGLPSELWKFITHKLKKSKSNWVTRPNV
jgi:hypothetical protein